MKSLGNAKKRKEKIKRTRKNQKGYEKVDLCKNGETKTFYIHRLVAQTFIPNINKLKEVNHKDENPANNKIDNLEWCTKSYNVNYGNRNRKVSEAQLGNKSKKIKQLNINGDFLRAWQSMRQASKELSINVGNISNCCNNKIKTAGGYKWAFLE